MYIPISVVEYADIVVDCPSPENVYQTPYDPTQVLGAVSETVPTVLPVKFDVPQDKDSEPEQKSFIGDTVPFNLNSSNLNVPVPVAPERLITIVIVPVKLLIAFETVVFPKVAPGFGVVPDPTLVPFIVIDQF
jgi:hypothetical protein